LANSIPAFNEHGTLRTTLQSADRYLACQDYLSEIIVIDDGSQVSLVGEICPSHTPIRFIRYKRNQGKGYAVRCGVESARGRYSCYMDADHSVAITHLPAFLEQLDHGYDLVIGSRFLPNSLIVNKRPLIRRCSSRVFRGLIHTLVMARLTDSQCGFKCFRSEIGKRVFDVQHTRRYGFDVEILARAQEQGLRILELPVVWNNNERTSKVQIVPDSIWTAIEVFRIALHVAFRRLLRFPKLVITHGQRCGNGGHPGRRLPTLRLVALELSKLAVVLLFAVWLGIALSLMSDTNRREHISYPESVYLTPLSLSE